MQSPPLTLSLGQLELPSGWVNRQALVSLVKCIQQQGGIGDDFRAHVKARLQAEAKVLSTLTLLHTIAFNCNVHLRNELAGPKWFKRIERLMRSPPNAKVASAVTQARSVLNACVSACPAAPLPSSIHTQEPISCLLTQAAVHARDLAVLRVLPCLCGKHCSTARWGLWTPRIYRLCTRCTSCQPPASQVPTRIILHLDPHRHAPRVACWLACTLGGLLPTCWHPAAHLAAGPSVTSVHASCGITVSVCSHGHC